MSARQSTQSNAPAEAMYGSDIRSLRERLSDNASDLKANAGKQRSSWTNMLLLTALICLLLCMAISGYLLFQDSVAGHANPLMMDTSQSQFSYEHAL